MKKLDFNKLKESFLDQDIYSPGTKKFMSFVLFGEKTKLLEDKYEKDLCEFNLHELKILLGSFKAISKESLRSKRTVVGKYTDYAIARGYVETRINFIDDIKEEDLDNLVYKIVVKNKYISNEDLEDLCNICINYQDEVILRAIYEGIKGERLSELINLKVRDVNFTNNKIKIYGENEREISVSKKLISTIEDAINQEEYENYITTTRSRVKSRRLYKTEYVLRKSNSAGGKIGYQSTLQRIKRVKTEAGYPILTVETIWWSGIFNYARKLLEKNRKLTDKDYDEIMNKFGCSKEYTYRFKVINSIKKNVK